ncbi:MAG: peptide chain release factor N(5)-glutamine methyltransferase [Elusimicrobiota bacterium]|jgi:release factor glutamine methyltransferase|nr:peptide chain release factor N(5)-glutamine methyltransferase [Elusimicrobiota bacterium]
MKNISQEFFYKQEKKNIGRALKEAAKFLIENGIENRQAQIDSEILLSAVLNIKRSKLPFIIKDELNFTQALKFKAYILRRSNREPTYYILSKCKFMDLDFEVNPDVLIPRQETEILVWKIIETFKKESKKDVLDLCCGSGAIAVSLCVFGNFQKITAVDISDKAIDIAKKNALLNNVDIDFINGDMFSKLEDRKFDIIVSNPPYVSEREKENLMPELFFEPATALFAKDGGLFFYKQIAKNAKKYLNENGHIFIELNSNLSLQIREIFYKSGYKNLEIIKDYSQLDRILWIKL